MGDSHLLFYVSASPDLCAWEYPADIMKIIYQSTNSGLMPKILHFYQAP